MSEEPRWGEAHEYRARPRLRRAPAPRPGARGGRGDQAAAGRGDQAAGGRPEEPAPRRPAPVTPREETWWDEADTPPPPPRRRRGGFGTFLVVLLVLLIGYPVALGLVGYTAVDRVGPLGLAASTPGHTTLLVGSDSREGTDIGGGGGARTDTILLLHRMGLTGPSVLVSVPRDSYVPIPGYGSNKINAAYAFGGPALLAQTIEGATGIAVDSYVETDLASFPDIVDAVGGVELCPQEPIQDPLAGHLDIEAGCQTMDGQTALGYARTRQGPDGDLGRVQRQRELIAAIAAQAASPATLLNPLEAFPLARSAGSALAVDDGTGPIDLAQFGMGLLQTTGGDALSLTVPVGGLSRREGAGSVVDWDTEQADRLFSALLAGDEQTVREIAEAQPQAR